MAKVRKVIGSSELDQNIETLLREKGLLQQHQLVLSVEIVVGDKPSTIIKVSHQNGRKFSAKAPKKSKPKSKVGAVPSSERNINMRRLRLLSGLKMQIVNALKKERITTVGAIREMPLAEVLNIKNISKSRALEIKNALAGIDVVVDWDI